VTPNFVNGVHFSGFITVDSTGISSTPIDLTSSMIQSWQISVLDSTNTLLFSMSPPTDSISMTTDSTNGITEFVAPEITTTSIFLPALAGASASESYSEAFQILSPSPASSVPSVNWLGAVEVLGSGGGFAVPDLPGLPQQISLTNAYVVGSAGTQVAGFSTFPNEAIDIATVEPTTTAIPEPASLAIWSLIAGVIGVGLIVKRRRQNMDAI
jgi:hypothetical protein